MSDIAKIIYSQINGRRLSIMTGATNFIDHGNALSFRFKMNKKMNYIKITLNDNDLYDMEFGKVHGMKYKVVAEHTDIYFDKLLTIFRQETGLATNL